MKRQKKRRHESSSALQAAQSTTGSEFLRYIRDLFQQGDSVQALETVDRRLAHESDPVQQARLLGLVADAQWRQGRFSEAISIFQRAAELVASEPREWLRPRLGLMRCLLKNVQVAEARMEAWAIVQQAIDKQKAFSNYLSQSVQQLPSQASVVIPQRPHRISVVATQLGREFIQEGEAEIGRELLDYAIKEDDQEGSRARQLLAMLALRKGDWSEALKGARQALLIGKFQAKTVACWPVYLTARDQLGQPGVEVELLQGLKQAAPSIVARSILSIVKTLRSQNHPQWQELSQEWLAQWNGAGGQKFSEIAADLRKIELAEAKRSGAETLTRLQRAQSLLTTPNLSPIEWLSAAKEVVIQSYSLSNPINAEELLQAAVERFGSYWLGRLRHGLALACWEAGNKVQAETFLTQNKEQLKSENEFWGRSVWRLAKMQAAQGQHALAAPLYWQFYQQSQHPQRLRFYALIEAARQFLLSEDTDGLLALREPLAIVVEQIQDFELLLDLARQLISAPPQFNALAQRFLDRGRRLAQTAWEQASNPSAAATILFKWARRLNDFGNQAAIAVIWRGMNQQKRDWLWQNKQEFWHWLAYVYHALWQTGQESEADALIRSYLNDPATPHDGRVILRVGHAVRLMQQAKINQALKEFEQAIQLNPTHESNVISWYWLGLTELKRNHSQPAREAFHQVKKILGEKAELGWKARLLEKTQALQQWFDHQTEFPEMIQSDWARLNF